MEPARYDFTIYQGATFSRFLTWKDDQGVVIDLSGYTARMQARSKFNEDAEPLFSLTTENGGILVASGSPNITIGISASGTTDLAAGAWDYDLELQTGDIVYRLMDGTVTVDPEITR